MEQTVQDAPDEQVSLTDPDARSMATSGKGTATVGYNVQIAVADPLPMVMPTTLFSKMEYTITANAVAINGLENLDTTTTNLLISDFRSMVDNLVRTLVTPPIPENNTIVTRVFGATRQTVLPDAGRAALRRRRRAAFHCAPAPLPAVVAGDVVAAGAAVAVLGSSGLTQNESSPAQRERHRLALGPAHDEIRIPRATFRAAQPVRPSQHSRRGGVLFHQLGRVRLKPVKASPASHDQPDLAGIGLAEGQERHLTSSSAPLRQHMAWLADRLRRRVRRHGRCGCRVDRSPAAP